MDLLDSDAARLRFEAYVKELAIVLGHADRVVPLHDYCTGLLLPGERGAPTLILISGSAVMRSRRREATATCCEP